MVVDFHNRERLSIANSSLLQYSLRVTLGIVSDIIALIHDEESAARANGATDLVQEPVHEIGGHVRQPKGREQQIIFPLGLPGEQVGFLIGDSVIGDAAPIDPNHFG